MAVGGVVVLQLGSNGDHEGTHEILGSVKGLLSI